MIIIALHNAFKQFAMIFSHRFANPVQHVPAAFLRDFQQAVEFQRVNRFLGVQDNEDCHEPLPQPDMGFVEDRTSGRRKLIAAAEACPLLPLGECTCAVALTAGTADTFRPTHSNQMLATRFIVRESLCKFNQIHGTDLSVRAGSARMQSVTGHSGQPARLSLPAIAVTTAGVLSTYLIVATNMASFNRRGYKYILNRRKSWLQSLAWDESRYQMKNAGTSHCVSG